METGDAAEWLLHAESDLRYATLGRGAPGILQSQVAFHAQQAADEELAHLKSDFQIKVAAKRREFLEQEAKVYYNIYREVEDSVTQFALQNRIQLVLRYTSDEMKADDRSSVLQGVNKPVVFQDRLDITQHVLNKLNAGATMPRR